MQTRFRPSSALCFPVRPTPYDSIAKMPSAKRMLDMRHGSGGRKQGRGRTLASPPSAPAKAPGRRVHTLCHVLSCGRRRPRESTGQKGSTQASLLPCAFVGACRPLQKAQVRRVLVSYGGMFGLPPPSPRERTGQKGHRPLQIGVGWHRARAATWRCPWSMLYGPHCRDLQGDDPTSIQINPAIRCRQHKRRACRKSSRPHSAVQGWGRADVVGSDTFSHVVLSRLTNRCYRF